MVDILLIWFGHIALAYHNGYRRRLFYFFK
jgi:hypothetical protein